MLIYEKDNKLNISFENMEETDIVVGKDEVKIGEATISENNILPVPKEGDTGKVPTVQEDGSYELVEKSEIHVTLHPDTMQFTFNSNEAKDAVQSGTPFKMSVTIDGATRYLLCQLNSVVSTDTYKATLIDGYVIYTAQVVFNGATATIYTDTGSTVFHVEELRKISVEPCASNDGHNNVFWGYNDDGILSFNPVPNFFISIIHESTLTNQFVTVINTLKNAAMSASDKKASGYVYVGDVANSLLQGTFDLLSESKQQILKLGRYFLAFDGFVMDSACENAEAATYRAMDIDSPATVGTDPVVIYKIRFTVTNDGLVVVEVEANAAPALPVQP